MLSRLRFSALLFFALAAATGLAALLAGCSSERGSRELALQLVPGTTMSFTLAASQDIRQSAGGRNLALTQETRTSYRFEVREASPAGRLTVHALYEAITLSIRSPAGALSWDSRRPDEGTAALRPMGELVGKGFDFVVSRRGEIEEVRGVELLAEQIGDSLRNVGGVPSAAVSPVSWLSGQSVASDLALFFCPYPDGGVAVGDSWQTDRRDGSGLGVRMTNRWTLARRAGGTATIALASMVGSTAAGSGLSGTQKGTFTVQPATGRVLAASIGQAIGGTIDVKGTPVTIDIRSRIRISGE
jgi:hypothetical protein